MKKIHDGRVSDSASLDFFGGGFRFFGSDVSGFTSILCFGGFVVKGFFFVTWRKKMIGRWSQGEFSFHLLIQKMMGQSEVILFQSLRNQQNSTEFIA